MDSALRAAALDDPRFEPDRLREAVREILDPFERVETARELRALWWSRFRTWLPWWARRPPLSYGPGGARVTVTARRMEVMTLRTVGRHEPAEAVVRVDLGVRYWPRVAVLGPLVRALQWRSPADRVLWLTLVAAGGSSAWELGRVDFDEAGEYHLAAETVPEALRDPAIADEARHELAGDDAVEDPGELLRADDDAWRQLLDLALVDGRFAPEVVEASIRTLIRAWRQMVIGAEGALAAFVAMSSEEIAEYARAADLPVRLRDVEVLAVVASPHPVLFVRIGALVRLPSGTGETNLWWQLALDDEHAAHWRLADAYARPELRALRRAQERRRS